jgi:formylglycine-generating enzyme required for sulfatase activity
MGFYGKDIDPITTLYISEAHENLFINPQKALLMIKNAVDSILFKIFQATHRDISNIGYEDTYQRWLQLPAEFPEFIRSDVIQIRELLKMDIKVADVTNKEKLIQVLFYLYDLIRFYMHDILGRDITKETKTNVKSYIGFLYYKSVKMMYIEGNGKVSKSGYSFLQKEAESLGIEPQDAKALEFLFLALNPEFQSHEEKYKVFSSDNTIIKVFGMEFSYIKPGEFYLGAVPQDKNAREDEMPRIRVMIQNGFYFGRYPVTQDQFEKIMNYNPSKFKFKNNPVESVSWLEAKDYLNKLNSQDSEFHFRLPSEAEWEFACRSGTEFKYYWGDEIEGEYCFFSENSRNQTHSVGQKKPNPNNLFDMIGNVWEWTEDGYSKTQYADLLLNSKIILDPVSENYNTPNKSIRGSSWSSKSTHLPVSRRNHSAPGGRSDRLGFRVLMEKKT